MVTSRDVDPADEPAARSRSSVDFALVVGIDHYPRFRSLAGAITDATTIHAWLCDPGGGRVDPANARLIVSRPQPAAPIQDEIDEQIVELLTAARTIGGGRRFYFHFSGHGVMSPSESGEDVALLLAKWSRTMVRLALSTDEYRGALGAMGLFEEIVIFLDCCRSLSDHVVGLPPTFWVAPPERRCATRTFLAYATQAGRTAFEECSEVVWQGMFTKRLLTILQRSPGGIEAADLKNALEIERATQPAQIQNGLVPGSTFGRNGVLPRLEVRFVTATGRVWLVDGKYQVVAQRDANSEPWILQLPAGLYKLEHGTGPGVLIDHGRDEVTRVVL
jgi:Caspase domain